MIDGQIYWLEDYDGDGRGGIFYRAFDLIQFIKLVEQKDGRVVGICFKGNNMELIVDGDTSIKSKGEADEGCRSGQILSA